MSDASKAMVWEAEWAPWGSPHSITAAPELMQRFPGQWFQLEADLHYNWHRHYDPTLGRYTQPDPLGFVDGPSVYAYAKNNPQMYVDPDGRLAQLLIPLARCASSGPCVRAVASGIAATIAGVQAYLNPPKADSPWICPVPSIMEGDGDQNGPEQPEKDGEDGDGAKQPPKIHDGKQGKHSPDHNNYDPGRSTVTHPNPQDLIDRGAGTGQQIGTTPVGQAGSKERVDYGEVIGEHVDPSTGVRTPSTIGIIVYGGDGRVHVYPGRAK
ncbi:MAG: RHS repeat-associated core domain-containing protein [Pseudomonadota bacterium]